MKKILIAAIILTISSSFIYSTNISSNSNPDSMKYVDSEHDSGSLNEDSTLQKEWKAIHDPRMKIDIIGTPGVEVSYHYSSRRGFYHGYIVSYEVRANEDIVAFEIQFALIDIWGNFITNLMDYYIGDIKAGDTYEGHGWYPTTSPDKYYASIAYISKTRTKSGEIIKYDIKDLLNAIEELGISMNAEDLPED